MKSKNEGMTDDMIDGTLAYTEPLSSEFFHSLARSPKFIHAGPRSPDETLRFFCPTREAILAPNMSLSLQVRVAAVALMARAPPEER